MISVECIINEMCLKISVLHIYVTGHKQKINNLLVLDLFPFHLAQDYLLVEGFSRTPSSFDVLKLVGVVYGHTQVCAYSILKWHSIM